MRIWSFVSQKGGSGKSTLATQLAVYAGQCDESVIIVDCDPQGSATTWHELRGEGKSPKVIKTPVDRFNAVLDAIRESGAFSLVLIDTAPHSDHGAEKAIAAASLIVCPTRPSNFDMSALRSTARLIQMSEATDKAAVVINCVPPRGAEKTHAKATETVNRLGLPSMQAFITDRSSYVKATDAGKGVTEMSDKTASKEIQRLWDEITTAWSATAIKEKQA